MRWSWQQGDQQPTQTSPPLSTNGSPSSTSKPSTDDQPSTTLQSDLQTLKSSLTQPSTLIATALLTSTLLAARYIYATHLRRIPTVAHIPTTLLPAPTTTSAPTTNPSSLLGRVTSVGDADNFRFYHTPGGALAGFPWLRRVPSSKLALKGQTLHVRLSGVDAPELPHFGKPGQRGGKEALAWLRAELPEGVAVRAFLLRRDQYGRVVARCFRRRWYGAWGRDVGLEMVKAGWAAVYEARYGKEFGGEGVEEVYEQAEKRARRERRGMWGDAVEPVERDDNEASQRWWQWVKRMFMKRETEHVETPREFKNRTSKVEEGKGKK